jgi:hypothetical protein
VREKQFDELAEMLGDEHNLSVLCAVLVDDADHALVERLRSRQDELRTKALAAGARLYVTPARQFIARVQRWRHAPAAAPARRKTA